MSIVVSILDFVLRSDLTFVAMRASWQMSQWLSELPSVNKDVIIITIIITLLANNSNIYL